MELTIVAGRNRKSLDRVFSNWIGKAQEFGLRFLRTGSRWFSGAGHIQNDDGTFFEPDENVLAVSEHRKRVDRVAETIQGRGLGYVRAVKLGLEFSTRDHKVGEWWLQGLKRGRSDQERTNVAFAVREWAGADSIAAHIGYDLDLFCTKDHGRNAEGDSILNPANRTWLEQTCGLKFVTLSELAAMVG
jgi:hypothetical protein